MDDLLNKFAKAKDSGTSTEASKPVETDSPDLDRGHDLIDSSAGSAESGKGSVDTSSQSTASQVEPVVAPDSDSSSASTIDDWTKDSALKEIKKLREENKAKRIKYEEKLSEMQVSLDARLEQERREMQEALVAKQELEELKEKEADKKRDLTEKVAHREALAAELKQKLEHTQSQYESELEQLKAEVSQYRADREAEQEVYKSRVSEIIQEIPEKFRQQAELISKGAGDPRDALVALQEAKVAGMFEDQTVVVNHSVPDAKGGARSSKERLEEGARAERAKMNSSQKIGEALKQIRDGSPNSAFRTK